MFRLLDGGAKGDMAGLSPARFTEPPGTTPLHAAGKRMLDRADWLLAMIPTFPRRGSSK
jgi:hypothetical protein